MTHLWFDGQCEEAFKLYAACLGGEITLMLTYGEAPRGTGAVGLADKIAHATLKFGDKALTGVDVQAEKYERPQGIALQLDINGLDEAERIFPALAEGGLVHFPMQQTFWAERYGVLTDQFGTPWEINCTATRIESSR